MLDERAAYIHLRRGVALGEIGDQFRMRAGGTPPSSASMRWAMSAISW